MKTVSFFSYKGGAGRTTLTINVIPYLIERLNPTPEKPLILVDMDIDSCGLTYIFDIDKNPEKYPEFKSGDGTVQKYFGSRGGVPQDDVENILEHRAFTRLCKVGNYFGVQDECVLCLPAYPGSALGFGNSYDGNDKNIKEFKELCEVYGCVGLVLDSAVGDQLTARWSNALSNKIVCCLRPTKQFRDGTERFFFTFDKNNRNKTVIVVPNVVPTDKFRILNPDGTSHEYPDYARSEINKIFDRFSNNRYVRDVVNGDIFGVPKIDRFMWQESVLKLNYEKDNPFERQALQQYELIAKLICE